MAGRVVVEHRWYDGPTLVNVLIADQSEGVFWRPRRWLPATHYQYEVLGLPGKCWTIYPR